MKTIVFDMYGVIAKDPGGNLLPFVRRSFPHYGEEDVYVHWRAMAAGELSTSGFWKNLGYPDPHSDTQRAYLDSIEIDPEFFAAARILKQKYRLALLSNDIAEWSLYLRQKHGLDDWFDAVVVSGDVGVKKPDPAIYRLLLDRLGQEPGDCVFIDDRERFLAAAQNLGMRVALFNSRKVPWEGDVVNDFQELLALLLPPEAARGV